ncbi:MAG TPA: fibronectin type III domain-containing protein [Bacteroidales bacterium]|nr:fibronectin type III domain-containing protein [Bacteroidales bacterium]
MVKYIATILQALESFIAGMKANAAQWTNLPLTLTELEGLLTQLKDQSGKIDAADAALQNERDAAHKLVDVVKAKLTKGENLAMGLYSDNPVKLTEYGLTPRKGVEPRNVPGKVTNLSLTDDKDGEGFIFGWAPATDADYYEIEKKEAPNSTDLVLAPPYNFLKTTRKAGITDDDVVKGKRYFYRVRAVNSAGPGEWSEPISKVQ